MLLLQFSVQGLCIQVRAGFVQMIFYNSSTEKNGMNSSSVSMASLQRIQVTSSRLQAVHEIQWNPQGKQKKVRNSRGEFEIADSN